MQSIIKKSTAKKFIAQEDKYGAHNYHPLPVVLSRGEGVFVWDVAGKKYYDFLSAYSAVNQGHSHPRIINALTTQAQQLALTSRAFHNDQLGPYEQYITQYFGFEKVLPMNTGAEAVETALKICRKWGYEKKGVPANESIIIVCSQNFHGRTTTIISFSSDPEARNNFGPYTPGFVSVPYNDINSMAKALENPNVVGVLVEPIQGEAGVIVPDEIYLPKIAEMCKEKNVLFMADEIQTGIGRTGGLLAVCGNCTCNKHCERQTATYARPDVLILGKALSGGVYPVSAVLADDKIMDVIQPGQHGSTYGGNPIAAAVATAALEVLRDENLTQNARRLGKIFRQYVQNLLPKIPLIKLVRGRGLLNAIVVNDSADSSTAWDICMELAENGLLAKPTHGNIIRLAPPLVITEAQLLECCQIIERVFTKFDKAMSKKK
jgi:ornithine--oxo-acid transaminase